ncbi:uncharacterized protein LOC109920193 [Rhincodon typus]|uniref:uncharacterized protein LOC109920193 n=1 Tax=Rhincodon typus TaxID=259920 RepID=UPI00202F46EE|nr:uncharacterized protein LOC109920193 [Rhincodon typus]
MATAYSPGDQLRENVKKLSVAVTRVSVSEERSLISSVLPLEASHMKIQVQNSGVAGGFECIAFALLLRKEGVNGCFSQSVTQSPTRVTAKECQTLAITCVFDDYHFFHTYRYVSGQFFRQTQTMTEWEQVSGSGRFSMLSNEAPKTFSLEIRDVRVQDAATYYCKARYSMRGVTLCNDYYADGSGTVVTAEADSNSLVSQIPPRQTSAAGDTVTLSCDYSGFCQYTIYWHSQSSGQAPKYLLQRNTSEEQSEETATGGRASASIDHWTEVSQIIISRIQLSDSAVHYCARSRRSAHTVIQSTERVTQKPEHGGDYQYSDTELENSSTKTKTWWGIPTQ